MTKFINATYRVPTDFPDRLKAYKALTGALSLNKAINALMDDGLSLAKQRNAFGQTVPAKEKRT